MALPIIQPSITSSGHAIQSSTSSPTLNFEHSSFTTSIEGQIKEVLKASSVTAVKSSRSAIYYLVKRLVQKGQNIVSVNSINLLRNEVITEKLGVEVRLAESLTLSNIKSLTDANTKLLFMEAQAIHNLSIPDFQRIVVFAKSLDIPVAIHNTIGFVGQIFNPLAWGAHFSIESLPYWLEHKTPFTSFIIEGESNPYSITERIKPSEVGNKESQITSKEIEQELDLIKEKVKLIADATLALAKWLKENILVREVTYAGLPNNNRHFTALKYFSSGFGNMISFAFESTTQHFDVLLDNLMPKSELLFRLLDVNYANKSLTIQLNTDDAQKIINHLEHALELVSLKR